MYTIDTLDNGLRIVTSPMPKMESVSLGFWIGVGGRDEPRKLSGISHFIEHMLFKGTDKYDAKALKESIEGVGGLLNGFTSDEVTCYMVKVPAKYAQKSLEILSEMVINPAFTEEDMFKEKGVILEEIKMYRDQPSERVHELLEEVMWPDNPLGMPLTGYIDTVRSLNRDDILRYKENHYHPSNITVIAAGKVDHKRIRGFVEAKFLGKKKKPHSFKAPKVRKQGPYFKFESSKTKQVHIAFGYPSFHKTKKEKYALKLSSIILGGNMSSRLFEELREKRGLCYDIAAQYKSHNDVGEFTVHAGVDRAKTMEAITRIMHELNVIKEQDVSEEELSRAKEYAKGQFLLALENTATRMMWLGDRIMVENKIPAVDDVIKRIDAVSPGMLKKILNQVFVNNKTNLAVVGNISRLGKDRIRRAVESS